MASWAWRSRGVCPSVVPHPARCRSRGQMAQKSMDKEARPFSPRNCATQGSFRLFTQEVKHI